MPVSVIKMLDEDGEINELATYTLDSEQALISYYMQHVEKNFNTAGYPVTHEAVKERPMGLGHYYLAGAALIMSQPCEDNVAIYQSLKQEQGVFA